MNTSEALIILKEHQNWRLGKTDEMPHEPKVLTEAIDVLIKDAETIESLKTYLNERLDLFMNLEPEDMGLSQRGAYDAYHNILKQITL